MDTHAQATLPVVLSFCLLTKINSKEPRLQANTLRANTIGSVGTASINIFNIYISASWNLSLDAYLTIHVNSYTLYVLSVDFKETLFSIEGFSVCPTTYA